MADVPISGLPAASTVSGPDLIPIVQGGTTKQATAALMFNSVADLSAAATLALSNLIAANVSGTGNSVTVQILLNTGAGASSIGAGLTDKLGAFRSSVFKTTTVNSVLDAGTALSSGSTLSPSDTLLTFQGGVAKQIASSALSPASSLFAGLLSSTDKTKLDASNSSGNANTLAQYSSTGGLHPARLLLNRGSGSGLVIDSMWFDPAQKSFSGGSSTENFNITVPSGVFSSIPTWGIIIPEDPHYNGTWLNTDPGNSTTNLVCQLYKNDGGSIVGGTKVLFGLWVYLTGTPE